MRTALSTLLLLYCISCSTNERSHNFGSVVIETVFTDSLSIRALELMDGSMAFAGSKGSYGLLDLNSGSIKTNRQFYDSLVPEYRAIAHTSKDFFMLSAGNPALLYKTGDSGKMELVYKEEHPDVFYDAMTFINDLEGVAVGDSMDGCLSVLITKDGGTTWHKTPCSQLPASQPGEGAFAASNTNIVTSGNSIWIGTTQSRVYLSKDKGNSWRVIEAPLVKEASTQGIYTLAFYNEKLGIAMGGDYTQPQQNTLNKAVTTDGGLRWKPIATGMAPGYTSCVQFVPNSGGNDLIALGHDGIYYSKSMGVSWVKLAPDVFYTLRFINENEAIAAGKNRIAKLNFQ